MIIHKEAQSHFMNMPFSIQRWDAMTTAATVNINQMSSFGKNTPSHALCIE